jgi:hypothetical protein
MSVSAQIPFGLAWLPVHTAVQFHDEPPLEAVKINGVLIDGGLPPKLEALKSKSPQQTPRRLFSFGCRLAEVARSVNQFYATRD